MNAIKTGKYILKRTWGIFLLAAIIIAGGTWEKRITDFENPKVYAWWEPSTRNSALKKWRITGKISR